MGESGDKATVPYAGHMQQADTAYQAALKSGDEDLIAQTLQALTNTTLDWESAVKAEYSDGEGGYAATSDPFINAALKASMAVSEAAVNAGGMPGETGPAEEFLETQSDAVAEAFKALRHH